MGKWTHWLVAVIWGAASAMPAAESGGEIKKTFNDQPFAYTRKLVEQTPEYEMYRLEYPSAAPAACPESARIVAYYCKPVKPAGNPAPAVVCLHILGGNGDLTRMIAAYFAARGMPALMPLMPLFAERSPAGGRTNALNAPGGGKLLAMSFNQSRSDIRRSIDWLAAQPGIDAARINLVGTSWGGILGASAAGSDPRIDKAVLLLAGGDLQTILNCDVPEVRPIAKALAAASPDDRDFITAAVAGIEPLNYAAVLADKAKAGKFRMVNAELDEVIPPENTRKLALAAGLTEGVNFSVMPRLSHYSAIAALPDLLNQLAVYFGGDAINPVPPRPPVAGAEVIKAVFGELVTLLGWSPPAGEMMRVSARFEVLRQDRVTASGYVAFDRGPGGEFALRTEDVSGVSEIENLRLGRGQYPWVESRNGTVFVGDREPVGLQNMEPLFSPKLAMLRQTATMVFQMVALSGSPAVLEKFVSLKLVETPDGKRAIRVADKHFEAMIQLEDKRAVPAALTVRDGDTLTRVVFTRWDLCAPLDAEAFVPPPGEKRVQVSGQMLEKVIASSFNFFIENGVQK